jgi:23S rRNA (pseudouridine1915-N3)-methyltransferase
MLRLNGKGKRMLHVTFLCVGKMKEKYLAEALEEYRKRLTRFCLFEVTELPECGSLEKEGAALLPRIPSGAFPVALCVEGKSMTSEGLAALMQERALAGISRICFIIGGSEGLAGTVKERAEILLSLSEMTFPHHLARVMLAEQVYRAFTILQGCRYHK